MTERTSRQAAEGSFLTDRSIYYLMVPLFYCKNARVDLRLPILYASPRFTEYTFVHFFLFVEDSLFHGKHTYHKTYWLIGRVAVIL